MIELIFVIVILGILSAIAIPKYFSSIEDAYIAKGRDIVFSVRNGISSRKSFRLLSGESNVWSPFLDNNQTTATELFKQDDLGGAILQYPIYSSASTGGWEKTNFATSGSIHTSTYIFHSPQGSITFTYNDQNGTFDCDHSNAICKQLTE